ncbi:MAG TPA: hypothetical protein VFM25_01370 [Verrucomicrobiae bacterium]|nr:hypothetical protein [Verrucomicrobiae bacterium]
MADSDGRRNSACNNPVMNPALRMRVDGNIVMLAAHFRQKTKRRNFAFFQEIPPENVIQKGIALQNILRPTPQNQRVNLRSWKIFAKLVNQWSGQKRIADSRQ